MSSTSSPTPCARQHLAELVAALEDFDSGVEQAHRWGEVVARAFRGGGRLLAAGNGGSAAQAQHLTAELVGRFRLDRDPLSAICLTAETSSLTAIINDYPPEELFARQVAAHARAGDVLAVFSTSGRSRNVVAAARRARDLGVTVLGFTGPPPNELATACDDALCVNADYTATVQELHLVALHVLCAAVDEQLGLASTHGPSPIASSNGASGLSGDVTSRRTGEVAGEMATEVPGKAVAS